MHLSIKAKQIGGISLIVALAILVLSYVFLTTLVEVSLKESAARGELLKNAIYHRAQAVVPGQANAHEALREDGGLRSILESTIYETRSVLYADIRDATGKAIVSSDPTREGKQAPAVGRLDDVLAMPALARLVRIYSSEGQTLEIGENLTLAGADFGSIRVGISTLLIQRDLREWVKPPALIAVAALLLAILAAGAFTRLMLRPIHVIRGGLTRLGRGEFGFRLDLPQQDEFGELGSFFNTVSAQLSADRSQLAGQKANLESAVEHMEDEVAILNPSGELLFANPAMRIALPYDSFGRPFDDVLPVGHPYRDIIQGALAERQSRGPISVTIPVAPVEGDEAQAPAGEERLVMAHAIKDRDQKLIGVMLVSRDVEYMGRVQSMLNYSRKLVALGRLSAGVAHEVKNPLNAMTIHLELLKQKLSALAGGGRPAVARAAAAAGEAGSVTGLGLSTATAPRPVAPEVGPALEHVKIISGEIHRLDQVMQGFLKFTRSEDLKLQDLALGGLVDEIVRVVEPECGKAGVTIKTEGFDKLPEISGDPTMLRQAFLNLALNACQAMPNGGTLRIVGAPASGRRVEIRFEDTGVGIAPEHLKRIFDLYFTTKEKGSGIGLSMVYRIVQMHDGDIEVQSTQGRGTTFRLLLQQA